MINKIQTDSLKTNIFSKVTVPLLYDAGKKLKSVGSGFLFETNGKIFLITAMHITKDWGDFLFIPTESDKRFFPAGQLTSISLKGCVPGSSDDHFDTAVIELRNPEELRNYYQIADSGLFQTDAVPGERYQYAIVGYPSSKTKLNRIKKTANLNLCAYYSKEHGNGAYDGISYWPESHIALDFQKKAILYETGEKTTAPDFNGVSGGPLWIIKTADEPNEESYRIFGINIEFNSEKSLFYGTKIRLILNSIARIYSFKDL